MTKYTAGAINIYSGFSDDAVPPNALPTPVPEGSLYVFLDKPQIWIARNNVWTYLMPITLVLSTPIGGPSDTAPIPSAGSNGGSTTINRQVVALGSNIDQQLPQLEQAMIRIQEDLTAMLAEMRVQTLFLQGLNQIPVNEDIETLRAGLLAADETITR